MGAAVLETRLLAASRGVLVAKKSIRRRPYRPYHGSTPRMPPTLLPPDLSAIAAKRRRLEQRRWRCGAWRRHSWARLACAVRHARSGRCQARAHRKSAHAHCLLVARGRGGLSACSKRPHPAPRAANCSGTSSARWPRAALAIKSAPSWLRPMSKNCVRTPTREARSSISSSARCAARFSIAAMRRASPIMGPNLTPRARQPESCEAQKE
jgi:hypothetical protein